MIHCSRHLIFNTFPGSSRPGHDGKCEKTGYTDSGKCEKLDSYSTDNVKNAIFATKNSGYGQTAEKKSGQISDGMEE